MTLLWCVGDANQPPHPLTSTPLLPCNFRPTHPHSTDIMRDIPIVPDGPGLIAYLEILERVLIPPPTVIAQARAAERGKGAGNDSVHVDRYKMPRPGSKADKADRDGKEGLSLEAKGTAAGVQKDGKGKPVPKDKDSPVSVLVNVIRKALQSFIVTDDTLESAWMCLLKAFRRFDPSESGTVAPRDFCLAVSVLLGGDEVLLSADAWREVIEHFTHKDDKKARPSSRAVTAGGDKGGSVLVDYMSFCGAILDSKDIKAGHSAMKGLTSDVRAAEKAGAATQATGGRGATAAKGAIAGAVTTGSQSRDRARATKK